MRTLPARGRGPSRRPAQYSAYESKFVSPNGALACDTTGTISLLNGIAPGTAVNERLGRIVVLDKLKLLIQDQVTPATGVDQFHRLLVVADKQPNGAALAITDVLDSVSTVAMPNLANRARFRILYDDLHQLNATGEPFSQRTYSLSIPLNLRVVYNAGVAGTVADIATNSLYFITIGSVAAGATAGSTTYQSRTSFHNGV